MAGKEVAVNAQINQVSKIATESSLCRRPPETIPKLRRIHAAVAAR
jgi:hypothetical protein